MQLIGCGMIGREHIERIQNRIRGAQVVAVCDVFEEGAKKGAEIAGAGTKVYTDFNEAINDPDVNAVVVTTPGQFHKGPVLAAIKAGKPVFGTCAGMILLAQRLENDPNVYFGALDATVRRNAYGRQLGSFMATENVATFHADGTPAGVIENFPLVFIRGPFVAETGANARVMCEANGNTVALQQGRILATAFHPEITPDTRIHEFFLII